MPRDEDRSRAGDNLFRDLPPIEEGNVISSYKGLKVHPDRKLGNDGIHDEDLPGFCRLYGVHRVQRPTFLSGRIGVGVPFFPDFGVAVDDVGRGCVSLNFDDVNRIHALVMDSPNPAPDISVVMDGSRSIGFTAMERVYDQLAL